MRIVSDEDRDALERQGTPAVRDRALSQLSRDVEAPRTSRPGSWPGRVGPTLARGHGVAGAFAWGVMWRWRRWWSWPGGGGASDTAWFTPTSGGPPQRFAC